MIIGIIPKKNVCSKFDAVYEVEKMNLCMEIGYLSKQLSWSPENFKKIWGGQLQYSPCEFKSTNNLYKKSYILKKRRKFTKKNSNICSRSLQPLLTPRPNCPWCEWLDIHTDIRANVCAGVRLELSIVRTVRPRFFPRKKQVSLVQIYIIVWDVRVTSIKTAVGADLGVGARKR